MNLRSTPVGWPDIRCCWPKHLPLTLTLLILILIGFPGSVEASHLSGGQITATRITGNVYQVRLSVYRDCSGVNLGTTQTIRLSPTISGSSYRVTRVSVNDITPLCPGQTSQCQGGSVPGFEEHVYQTNITLTGLPIGQFYTISWQSCCRNPSITTLTTPSNDGFYLSTQINPSIVNSTPTFLNVPYAALCAGQPATISPNGSDPDGDALVYSLTNCLENPTTVVSYGSGFSGTSPLSTTSGFTLNSSTGELSFTPTVGGQVGVICLLAEEFRNGVKIGEIRRDIQVRVLGSCSNSTPTITQVSNQIVPVGTQYCVTVNASDADLDNITLSAISSVGSFTINSTSPGNASGTFCFTPGLANAGQTYTITIQGEDDGCPAPSTASTTFNITVPVPCNGRATASGTDASCAGSADGTATVAIQNFTPPIQYTWSNGGFTQTITGLTAGNYGVTVADANGCVDSSSVTIGGGTGNVAIGTNVTDANCGQSNGTLNASASGGTAPYTYNLSGVGSNSTGSFSNLAAGSYTLTVTDANGCDASSSITIGFAADTQAPTLAGVPGNTTVSCDNIPAPATVTATDDCDANVTVNFSQTTTPGNCPYNFTINRTWSATDAAGNTSTGTQSITVEDIQAPTISCPSNITMDNDAGDCAAIVTYPNATGSDNCGSVSFTYSQASGSSFPVGMTTVAVTGTDECGNSSSCSFTVTVNDTEAPNAICNNLTVQLDANGSASIMVDGVNGGSTDNCGIASVSIDNSNFSCSNVASPPSAWINEFHYDNDGADQGEFIEIAGSAGLDLTGWTVVRYNGANGTPYGTDALSGIIANTSNGFGFFVVNLPSNGLQNGAPDGIALIDNNGSVVQFISYESNPFTATAGPAAGVTSIDINVFESGATPVGFSLQLTGSGSSGGQFAWAPPASATPGAPNNGQTFLSAGSVVTLTVTDVNGNVSTCTSNITVEDNVAPTAVCQDLTVQLDNSGNVSITSNDVDNGSSDNCGIDNISIDMVSFTCANVGSNNVILTVNDINGNSSACTSEITVEDNVAPVAVCNNVTVQLDANGSASITASDIDGGSSDACGIASTTIDNGNFSCASVGGGTAPSPSAWINEFHYDNDGADQNESIEIAGTAGLDLTGWSVVRYNGANGAPYGTDALSGILANTSNGVGFFVVNLPSNGLQNGTPDGIALIDNNGSVVEFLSYEGSPFTATSGPAAGQTSVNIGVSESGATPVGFSLQLTGSGSQSSDFTWSAPSSATNGAANNGQTFTAPVAGNTVTLTVTDVNGNVSTCTGMVTVEDNIDPTITCPSNITVNNDAGVCGAVVNYNVTPGDNCGFTVAQTSGLPNAVNHPVGTTTNAFTVTDASGNTASCSFDVTVIDAEAPIVDCSAGGFGTNFLINSSFENGAAFNQPFGTDWTPFGAVFAIDANIIPQGQDGNYYLKMFGGNSGVFQDHPVNAGDNLTGSVYIENASFDPMLPGCEGFIKLEYFNATGGLISVTESNRVDNSLPSNTWTQILLNDVAPAGAATVRFVVIMQCNAGGAVMFDDASLINNSQSGGGLVGDILVGSDAGQCGAQIHVAVPANSDNCGVVSITNDFNGTGDASGFYPVGTTVVNWVVVDAAGNSSNCSITVTVNDTEDPTIVCPSNITVNNDAGVCGAVVNYGVTPADNCPGFTVAQTSGLPNGANHPVGVTTNAFTVTDAAGNTASCSFDVTVIDAEAPVIDCNMPAASSNILVNPSFENGAVFNTPFNTDWVTFGPVFAIDANIIPPGQDGNFYMKLFGGNTGMFQDHPVNGGESLTASVYVENASFDPMLPGCEGFIKLEYFGANGLISVTESNRVDHTLPSNTWTQIVLNDVAPAGATTVRFVVIMQCSAGGAVFFDDASLINNSQSSGGLSGNITVSNDPGQCGAQIMVATPFSSDNCGVVSVINDLNGTGNASGFYPVGTTTVVWTATDAAGNASTCSVDITVEDNEIPNAVCQNITVQLDANGNASITPADIDNGSTDNCGIASLSIDINAFDCSDVGGNTVTLTVTDIHGNSATCASTVTVEDNIAPNALCTDITIQLDGNGSAGITASDIDGGSNDNCGIASISASQTSFDCSNLGSNTVTLTVNDVNGNSSTCTANVEVEDNIAPMITCPADLSFECSDNVPAANANDASASDNCTVVSLTVVESDNGGTGCNGDPLVITRTYTATDQSGNSTSCDQTITVEATPIITTSSPNAYVFPAYPDSACTTISVSATGGCPGYTYQWSNGATTASQTVCPTVSTVYTVTVTDRLGCTSTDSVKVCVIDITCTGGDNNGQNGNGQGGQGSTNGNGQLHIQMCHVPNGNPNNAMTKCLPISAVQAHLAAGHGGDHLGACGSIAMRNCDFGGNSKQAASGIEVERQSSLEAFPNPFSSEVNIRFVLGQDDYATVKVYDLRGVEVLTLFEDEVREGEATELRFQPENLAKGIYYARLTTSNGQNMVQKLIYQ